MKTLHDGRGELLEEPDYYGPESFLAEACRSFPELQSDPDIAIGPHILMAALGRLIMDAVSSGSVDQAQRMVAFLDDVLRRPRLHPEIPNAVAISLFEPGSLQVTPSGRQIWDSMPASIRALLANSADS